ncbi:hypothetical protein ACVGVM_27445 [Pseudonocardia bannensis]|uniref:PPE family protein n=1 Tax=Pseudonocardia bannensis TaxID=630973 RepID=A0A848DFL7_9PSEU|nr:hypothetical protein [Pseudonocardia bannensis]NMH91331.1 hypothetical protein [Pseudonocardia bannensis]
MTAPGSGRAAAPVATEDPTEGARLLDSIADLQSAVVQGNWAGGLLNVMSGATEVAAFMADPLTELVAAGLGWLIEHVPHLREPFDQLAGDPSAIEALSAAWQRIAREADAAAADLRTVVDTDTAPWRGPAIEAYRPVAHGLVTTGVVAAAAARVAAVIVEQAGALVLAVRAVVRDELARAVADLITTFLRNIVAAGTGVGLLAVAGLLVHRALHWANRLLEWVRRVSEALDALRDLMARLAPALRHLEQAPAGLRAAGTAPAPRSPTTASGADPVVGIGAAGTSGPPTPAALAWSLAVETGKQHDATMFDQA